MNCTGSTALSQNIDFPGAPSSSYSFSARGDVLSLNSVIPTTYFKSTKRRRRMFAPRLPSSSVGRSLRSAFSTLESRPRVGEGQRGWRPFIGTKHMFACNCIGVQIIHTSCLLFLANTTTRTSFVCRRSTLQDNEAGDRLIR